MRNTLILIKNYFNCAIGSLLGKKKSRKGASGAVIVVMLFLAFGALLALQAYANGEVYNELGLIDILLFNGYMLPSIIVVFFALQKISGGAKSTDADLLLSMPLTKTSIIVAKTAAKYLITLATAFLFMAPYVIVYMIFAGFTTSVLFGSIILLLLIPMAALGLNYILDWFTIVLFKKAGAANILRSVVVLISVFGFLAAYLYVTLASNVYINESGSYNQNIAPVSWFVNFALSFDLLVLLKILAITVLPFILGIVLFATTFDKQNIISKKKTVNFASENARGVLSSIFNKELKQYVNIPLYMINTIFGVIFIIACTVAVAAFGADSLSSLFGGITFNQNDVALLITAIFCMLSGMTYASACAVSLEGRNLWILKTMPINTRVVLFAKTILNIVLVSPVVVICSVVLLFALKLSVFYFIIMLTLPVLVNIIISFGGLFINLVYPKLDWESEMTVVKQSMSVIITTMAGMLIGALPIVVFFIFASLSVEMIGLIVFLIYAALAAGAVALLMTKGKTLFERL